MPSIRARAARRAVAAMLVAWVVAASILVPAAPASAQSAPDVITLEGRGFGHGRGMGQYGALGYAVDIGWTYDQILDHFYSNTTFGDPVPDDLIEKIED